MDYIDYVEKLGLGFCDEDKQMQFINRIRVYLHARYDIPFDRNTENIFAYKIGEPSKIEEELMHSDFTLNFGPGPEGLQRVWLYLADKQNYFKRFLAALTIFANAYQGTKSNKESIMTAIKDAFRDSHIDYETFTDDDGLFFFPKGAKELDDALVSEPLEWLKDYPETQKELIVALKMYSDATSENAYKVADAFRAALERFFQNYFCAADRSLENFKDDLGTHLKNNGVPSEIRNIMIKNFELYNKYMNNYAKHTNKAKVNVLEFIMYQTGLTIRTIITLGKEE